MYYIDSNDIIKIIKPIPESLKCQYIIKKGTRKNLSCNVILCPHHSLNEPIKIDDEFIMFNQMIADTKRQLIEIDVLLNE